MLRKEDSNEREAIGYKPKPLLMAITVTMTLLKAVLVKTPISI